MFKKKQCCAEGRQSTSVRPSFTVDGSIENSEHSESRMRVVYF